MFLPGWVSRHTRKPVRRVARGYTGLAGRYTGMGPVQGKLLRMGLIRRAPQEGTTGRLNGDRGGTTLGR